MPAKNNPNALSITRVYNAPVKAVWDAWTDPQKAAMWWGPRGFSITTHSKDLRVGGVWHYTMHGPDGTDYPNKTKYFEVEEYKKLVYDHGGYDEREPLFRVEVLFSEKEGKTEMKMTMTFTSEQAMKEAKKMIKIANGNSTWDRLGEYVEKNQSGADVFIINRSFEAPIETVFAMWANPEHYEKWLPPTGFSMKILKGEIKAGSEIFYSMTSLDGQVKMFGRTRYLEVTQPHRIKNLQQFCDEDEKTSRHLFAPTWPETMMTTVTFSKEDEHQTRVTVEWQVHGAATKEEIATFLAERGGMTQGWSGSFDKLETLLGVHN